MKIFYNLSPKTFVFIVDKAKDRRRDVKSQTKQNECEEKKNMMGSKIPKQKIENCAGDSQHVFSNRKRK
jgi:hypothetical protein